MALSHCSHHAGVEPAVDYATGGVLPHVHQELDQVLPRWGQRGQRRQREQRGGVPTTVPQGRILGRSKFGVQRQVCWRPGALAAQLPMVYGVHRGVWNPLPNAGVMTSARCLVGTWQTNCAATCPQCTPPVALDS
jgi:hypothetical protein